MEFEEKIKKSIEQAVIDGLRSGIQDKFKSHYSDNPLNDIMAVAVAKQKEVISGIISDAIVESFSNDEFRSTVISELMSILARQLVQKFGGELEKQVNALKSYPTTRARITLAIEKIVKDKI